MWALALATICQFERPAHAQPTELSAQRDNEGKRLCGETKDLMPRVLIGRFSVFGEFEQDLSRILEQGFVSSLYLSLLQGKDNVVAFSWTNSAELPRFSNLKALIDNVFDDDDSGSVRETAAVRNKAALRHALLENNCDYLLSGRISRDGARVTVVPYLLSTLTGEIYRPFPPSGGDISSISKIAEGLARGLRAELNGTRQLNSKNRFVELGCFKVVGKIPPSIRSSLDSLADLLRRYVAQELRDDRKFLVKVPGDKILPCQASPAQTPENIAVTVTAEIRLGGTKQIEVLPSIRFAGQSVDRREGNTFRLPPIKQPFSPSSISSLPGEFASCVRSFLIAVTKADGAFPTEEEIADAPNISTFSNARAGLDQTEVQRAALAAYRELTKNPQSNEADFVLARVFVLKRESSLALEYFLKAKIAETSLPPALRAEMNESIGQTYVSLGNARESIQYFSNAKKFYLSTSDADAARRVNRKLSESLFLDGEKEKAIEELKRQSDIDSDGESLRLLGRFLSLSESHDEAIQWLSKALLINPSDNVAKSLLVGAHGALGRKAFADKEYISAREHFGLALNIQESGLLFYLAAVSAYEIGDFRDAARLLEKMIKLPSDKVALKLAEGGWLNLLECYLLLGDYPALDAQGEDAFRFLRWLPDSRLLAAYMRLMGEVLSNPKAEVAELKKSPSYIEIEAAPSGTSASTLEWDNTRIKEYLNKQNLDSAKRAFVEEVRKRVGLDSNALK
jgi:tetratricopeptide (TPR) repeat protein